MIINSHILSSFGLGLTAVFCFCLLMTSGVSVPPWPGSVGSQSLHSSHVS